jgi:hypothetical protein
MSEHRPRYPSRSSLFEGFCQSWPWCDCAMCLDHDALYSEVAEMADERFPAPTREQVEIVEVKVYVMLSCLSVKCPDVRVRRYASNLFTTANERSIARTDGGSDVANTEKERRIVCPRRSSNNRR